MRPICSLLVVLNAAAPLLAVDTSIIAARSAIHDTSVVALLGRPVAHTQTGVRFRATFCGVTDIYDRESSWFRPERHIAIAVWDERAKLWDPEVRADVLTTLYVDRDQVSQDSIEAMRRYQIVDITGRVRDVINGLPMIEVVSIAPVVDAKERTPGAFTAQAIWQVEQAVQLSADGAYDLAEDRFAAGLAADLTAAARADIGVLRGRNLAAAGQSSAAVEALSSALAQAEKDPGYPVASKARILASLAKARSDVAEANGGAGRESAVSAAREALAFDPDLGEAYAVLGISLAGLGQFDEARRQCDIAVRMLPNDPEVRWYLGRILDQQGRHAEAIEALNRAILLTPKDARLHRAIAEAYLNKGRAGGSGAAAALDMAIKEFDITLRLNPGDAETLLRSGQVIEEALHQGAEITVASQRQAATRELAMARYRAAISAAPRLSAAYAALAGCQIAAGQHAEALATAAALSAASDLPADRLSATVIAGRAHWAADDIQATISTLLPVASTMTDSDGLVALGWACAAGNRPLEAGQVAQRLAGVTTWQALELRGWILAIGGDPVGGERLLKEAQIADPALMGYRLGMVIYMQGPARWAEARTLLVQAKDINGRPSLLAGAKAQVAAILTTIDGAVPPSLPEKPAASAAPTAPEAKREPTPAPVAEPTPAEQPSAVSEVPVVEPQVLPVPTP